MERSATPLGSEQNDSPLARFITSKDDAEPIVVEWYPPLSHHHHTSHPLPSSSRTSGPPAVSIVVELHVCAPALERVRSVRNRQRDAVACQAHIDKLGFDDDDADRFIDVTDE
jgi:hypothetical protein